jgi:hypothetical protein
VGNLVRERGDPRRYHGLDCAVAPTGTHYISGGLSNAQHCSAQGVRAFGFWTVSRVRGQPLSALTPCRRWVDQGGVIPDPVASAKSAPGEKASNDGRDRKPQRVFAGKSEQPLERCRRGTRKAS